MLNHLEARPYGAPAERAVHLLIHYFRSAIGEETFRRNGHDLETEITEIVMNTINAAVSETMNQISKGQMETLRNHISEARQAMDNAAVEGAIHEELAPYRSAISHLTDVMDRIVERF